MTRLLAVLLCGWLAAGCTAWSYSRRIERVAAAEIASAQRAGAEARAPYDLALAVEYLAEARALAARSDYVGAERFGEKAIAAAKKARAAVPEPPRKPVRRIRMRQI
jgi:hypothetical protein